MVKKCLFTYYRYNKIAQIKLGKLDFMGPLNVDPSLYHVYACMPTLYKCTIMPCFTQFSVHLLLRAPFNFQFCIIIG